MGKQQLSDILFRAVADFGYDVVRESLALARQKHRDLKKQKQLSRAAKTVKPPKTTAVTVVSSLPITDKEKREFLLHLAKNYDAKEFMPNVNHARGFLMHDHDDPSRIKSRQQVTVRVFKKLAGMSIKDLRDLELCGLYDPPKSLAAFAEAIEGFGRAMRAKNPDWRR